MKTQLVRAVVKITTPLIAVCAFFIFSSLEKDEPNPAKAICCTGYNVPLSKLLQFMQDSLKSNDFEGGIYSKADLINAINSAAGDSIYLLNFIRNCDVASGTDLAITSKQSQTVYFVRNKLCPNCPGKPCCRNAAACVTKISRACIVSQSTPLFAEQNQLDAISSVK